MILFCRLLIVLIILKVFVKHPCQKKFKVYRTVTGSGALSHLTTGLLFWIVGAVGLNELTVRNAYEAASIANDRCHACGVIRKVSTWNMGYTLVQQIVSRGVSHVIFRGMHLSG